MKLEWYIGTCSKVAHNRSLVLPYKAPDPALLEENFQGNRSGEKGSVAGGDSY
jgi:hypothetical protein